MLFAGLSSGWVEADDAPDWCIGHPGGGEGAFEDEDDDDDDDAEACWPAIISAYLCRSIPATAL